MRSSRKQQSVDISTLLKPLHEYFNTTMISCGLFVIWVGLICYLAYKWMFYRPENFPPGPPRIPILGSYGFMLLLNYQHLYKAIAWLCKYYKTDVLGLYIGPYLTMVAHSNDATKESMNEPNFDGKPFLSLAAIREPDFKPYGVFFSDGDLWHEQRRFLLRYLRDYGFGRRFDELELELNDELLEFVDLLKNGPKYEHEKKYHDGKKVRVPHIFMALFSNAFAKTVINERLTREKSHILYEAGEHIYYFGQTASLWGRLFSILWWIPKLFPKWSDYDALRESAMKYYSIIKTIVDEQYATFDANHERHFLDKYFLEMEKTKDDPKSSFFHSQVVLTIADFFLPTFVANSITIQFLLQRFCLQPEVLRRCQNEIDEVVGPNRLPNLDDRIRLPYVEATVREILRHKTLGPDGFPHLATEDTEFRGFTIPKGTIIYGSVIACNMDETAWKAPELFQPERFLDENGKFSPKLDKSLPFSAGKRVCAGETFTRNMLFLAVAAIVQNFNFAIPKGEKLPMNAKTGMFQYLPEFSLEFLPR